MKLWGTIKNNHKIIKDFVTEIDIPKGEAAFLSGLKEICAEFDLSMPVVLSKHLDELDKFNRTVFKSQDFLEPINFDSFEIEIFDIKKKK